MRTVGPPVVSARNVGLVYPTSANPFAQMCASIWPARFAAGGHRALNNISFDIRRGECVGIIGKNGAGKSSLLQILAGTANATEGEIQVNGKVAALLELGAGFNPDFTGRENIFLSAALHGFTRWQAEQRFEEIEAFADIGEYIDEPVRTYSSGMHVRLAFSVIAHVDADILLIDEALAVGDAFFTQKCMRFLRRFREQGTLVFVSHDNGAVAALCSRVLWIQAGQIMADDTPELVIPRYLKFGWEQENGSSTEAPPAAPATFDDEADYPLGEALEEATQESSDFGVGAASIDHVALLDSGGVRTVSVHGGALVHLELQVSAKRDLAQPLAGFYFKNRLGQVVFGGNTDGLDRRAPPLPTGHSMKLRFSFKMPFLAKGEYVATVAVGDGTQDSHTIHQWIHDALAVAVRSSERHALLQTPISVQVLGVGSTEPTAA